MLPFPALHWKRDAAHRVIYTCVVRGLYRLHTRAGGHVSEPVLRVVGCSFPVDVGSVRPVPILISLYQKMCVLSATLLRDQ